MSETADPLPFHHDPWWHKAAILFVVIAPFAAAGYALYQLWGWAVTPIDLAMLVAAWVLTGLGISVGYHRMLTHRAFEAKAPVRAVLLTLGSMAFQGGAADWAATHIRHHANADREGDPHSPVEGFLHSHFGWLVRDRFVRSGPVYDKLMSDPVTNVITRWVMPIAIAGLIIPGLIGWAIAGTLTGLWHGLLWGGIVRVFLGHHITWSVNSVAHTFGTRPYETEDQARNNVIVAVLGFGEGWHNNHHAFPKAAFLGQRWWQFDPGRWLIKIMEKFGWVWNVWNPKPDDLQRRRA